MKFLKKVVAKASIKVMAFDLLELLLENYIWPKAKAFAAKTDTKVDNSAVKHAEYFFEKFLHDLKNEK